jgi:hypothetical protein
MGLAGLHRMDQSQAQMNLKEGKNMQDETNDSASTVNGMELRNVMTNSEMTILTTWFPKAAQTLACVMRKRPHDV